MGGIAAVMDNAIHAATVFNAKFFGGREQKKQVARHLSLPLQLCYNKCETVEALKILVRSVDTCNAPLLGTNQMSSVVLCGYKMSKKSDGCHFQNPPKDCQDKHFFKVMVGDFRERMAIPQKFVQHFLGRTTRIVNLGTRNGPAFEVQVINNLDKLVLGPGWEAFVSAHGINMGDFLVFKYDGNSYLNVVIFDPSGCEKAPSSVVMKKSTHKSQRNEPAGMSIPLHDIAMKSPQSERKAWAQWDSSSQGINIINISSPEASGDATFHKDDQEVHFVPRYILPFGTYLTGTLKKKVREKVRAIHSAIPIYVCVMKKSNISGKARCVNISRGYADEYLPFVEQALKLQCNGKNWVVRCVKVGERIRLWKGWKRFASENNLQLEDVCLFELLKNEEYRMNVHVIPRR
ncbi:hypothetical protein ACP70R_025031 [Stipagrostis hirtigluma subsp. patula]